MDREFGWSPRFLLAAFQLGAQFWTWESAWEYLLNEWTRVFAQRITSTSRESRRAYPTGKRQTRSNRVGWPEHIRTPEPASVLVHSPQSLVLDLIHSSHRNAWTKQRKSILALHETPTTKPPARKLHVATRRERHRSTPNRHPLGCFCYWTLHPFPSDAYRLSARV
jgi:hypothetical protein